MKAKLGYNDRLHAEAEARRKQIRVMLRKMTQVEVARILGITRQRVHQIVGGKGKCET